MRENLRVRQCTWGARRPQDASATPLPEHGSLDWGRFRFRVSNAAEHDSPWTAAIACTDGSLVRAWSSGDANIGVRNEPGAIVQTRMPCPARSRAIGRVIETIAPFAAA